MDDNKQSSVISDQSSDQTDQSVTQPEESEITQPEEASSPVIASDAEGETKQSTPEETPTQIAASPAAEEGTTEPAEEAVPEETPSPVIASDAEGGTKQSSSEENPTKIASSMTPRNDENETNEPVKDEPAKEPEAAEPEASEPTSPAKNDNPNAKWYVVHTYSGHENKVSHTLKQRVESEHLEDKILDVLVPTQDKIEIKGGKKVNIKEKIFPGYILVKMVLDDVSWLAVRTTQGVTSFVGIGNKPTPISEAEVQTIVKFTQTEAPMYKQVFMANDTVKIVDGPFADFIGKIDSVDEERGKVRVLVSIFGRETPVELDFLQIQKI